MRRAARLSATRLNVLARGLGLGAAALLVAGFTAGFGTNPPAAPASIGALDVAARSIAPAAADTLRFEVEAGAPFLHALPEPQRGEYVAYKAVELPALSWLQGRSVYWKTLPEQRGPHRLVLSRTTLDAVADTVVIVVDLQAD